MAHAKILVEIRDTGNPELGYGVLVRPYAHIMSNQNLGEYIGELVPAREDIHGDYIPFRHQLFCCYRV